MINANDIESKTIKCRRRFRSVDVLSYLTTSGEYLYSEVLPCGKCELETAILDTKKLLRANQYYGPSLYLIFNDKRLPLDKYSRVEDVMYEYYHYDVMYEYYHYDELYETAPAHLK